LGGTGVRRARLPRRTSPSAFTADCGAGRVWEGTSEIQRVIITGRVVNRGPGVLA